MRVERFTLLSACGLGTDKNSAGRLPVLLMIVAINILQTYNMSTHMNWEPELFIKGEIYCIVKSHPRVTFIPF